MLEQFFVLFERYSAKKKDMKKKTRRKKKTRKKVDDVQFVLIQCQIRLTFVT